MSYRLITEDEYDLYAPELKGSSAIVITDGNKFWYLKNGVNSGNDFNRDLLGYILGKEVANVAEVRPLTQEEFNEIKQLAGITYEFNPIKHYLIRIAGSYIFDELKWKTLEEAVAAELVFSIWIRRRDTHIDNRTYLNGVPIFFDHGVAFLHEPHMAHITIFSRVNSDHGQPNRWRIKLTDHEITTIEIRALDRSTKGAHHFVNDIEKFKTEVKKVIKLFQETFNRDLTTEIQQAGFTGDVVEIINEFLEVNLKSLNTDFEIMSKVIYRE